MGKAQTLKELTGRTWYRLVKVLYVPILVIASAFVGMVGAAAFSEFGKVEIQTARCPLYPFPNSCFGYEYPESSTVAFFGLIVGILALPAVHFLRRIFYYVYFGRFYPKIDDSETPRKRNESFAFVVGCIAFVLGGIWVLSGIFAEGGILATNIAVGGILMAGGYIAYQLLV